MPRVYKFMTALLALTGCVSLAATGALNPAFLLPGLALLPGYYRFLVGAAPAPRRAVAAGSAVAVAILAFDALAVSGDFFIAVAHMSIVFQALKSFDLRDPWDHLQVYFMSLLQLVMTSELAVSMYVGGVFVVFLLALVVAIVASHFIRAGSLGRVGLMKPVAAISLAAFVLTSVFFVAVPRAKGGLWSRKSSGGIRSVGFSDRVDFGSFGDALQDPTIVMRVSLSGRKLPLYWRGMTLDYFDGMSWRNTRRARYGVGKDGGRFNVLRGVEPVSRQEVFLEPIDTPVVFGLGVISSVESRGITLFRDGSGALFLPAKSDRRFTYTAYSIPQGSVAVARSERDRYLQLPPDVRRIASLAAEVAGDSATEQEAAARIESYLRDNFAYSLDTTPPPGGVSPVEHFLFSSRRGYCEHFASSMVLMLRTLGVPARIVTGFAGGEENGPGDYVIVRQRDAHSWVEASADGVWMRFDPTPPEPPRPASAVGLYLDKLRLNWYRYVVGFSSADQRGLARSLYSPSVGLPEFRGITLRVRAVYALALALLFVPLAGRAVAGWLSGAGVPAETKVYMRFRDRVRRRGGDVGPSSTPAEVAREARRLRLDASGAAGELVRLYEEARFGGVKLDGERKERYRELASQIR